MRGLVIAAVVCTSTIAAAKGKGAVMSADFTKAPLSEVLRLIGDVSKANIVILEGADTAIDVSVKATPWDDVLADVVAKANLAVVREGSLYIVGSQAAIDARKAQKKTKYAGVVLDIDVVGVDARDAGTLLAVATGKPIVLDGGTAATLRLRRVPSDLAREMIVLQTGATMGEPVKIPKAPTPDPKAAKSAKPAKACVAARLPLTDLEIVGIVRAGTKAWAMFGTRTSAETYIVDKAGCLGIESEKVTFLGADTVTAAGLAYPLHPEPVKPGAGVHK